MAAVGRRSVPPADGRGRGRRCERISGATGELVELGATLLLGGFATFPCLLRGVEEQVRVVGELLDAGQAVLVGVKARLQQAQRPSDPPMVIPATKRSTSRRGLLWLFQR
jgi:hypothetical protein